MKIFAKQHNQVVVMILQGKWTAADVTDYEQAVAPWLKTHANFILDLQDIDLMDSTGLGSLIASYRQVRQRGGTITLVGLAAQPRLLCEITRTLPLFKQFDELSEALQDFQLVGRT